MKEITFTREEFHELVWKESLTSISKKYDSTYYELRKQCENMAIPLPKAGYWQNLWLGKKMSIEPLTIKSDVNQQITLSLLEEGDIRKEKVRTVLKSSSGEAIPNESIVIPQRLTNPDRLILDAKKELESKESYGGVYKGIVTSAYRGLDISVSPANISRALKFMDTLIKGLRNMGYDIIIKNNETYAVFEEVEIQMTFREKSKRTEVIDKFNWKTYEYSPTGMLSLRIDLFMTHKEWVDGTSLIESKMPTILSVIDFKAKEHKERRAEWAKERARQEEERKQEKALEELRQQDVLDFQNLLKESQQWQQAKILDEYIDTIEASALEQNVLGEELKQWIIWARKKAEGHNAVNKRIGK